MARPGPELDKEYHALPPVSRDHGAAKEEVMTEKIEIAPIRDEDSAELTRVMTRAFDDDAKRHLGEEKGGPDGYDDGSFIARWAFHKDARCYVARLGHAIAGAIIVFPGAERSVLGCIFVDPVLQRRGIGEALWRHASALHPSRCWKLETPSWALSNHSFYEGRLGFHKAGETEPGDPRENQFIFERSC